MSALPHQRMSLAEFLAWEDLQPERHEFHQGEVFAMVGARRVHEVVVANLVRRLGNLLDGTPCQVLGSGMKLQVAEDTVLYPDVSVTCDQADRVAELAIRAPSLLIEVLSPSTQAYDRSKKFALYRQLASLREYLLVDPDTRRVEALRRDELGRWIFHDMSQDEQVELPVLNGSIALSQIFQGLEAPDSEAPPAPPAPPASATGA